MNNPVFSYAHGRVNLIGEHTDYNNGFVLPTAIPQKTRVKLKPREDREVYAHSKNVPSEEAKPHYSLGQEKKKHHWIDYIQGITHIASKEGYEISGFDLEIDSTVPLGGGLSSSAALEVAVFRALREAFQLAINDSEIALLGQKVENDFVGARVGVMDQMAASLADEGTALFLDTRDLSYRKIPIPSSCGLIVIHSGVTHRNNDGAYNQRRTECEEAANLLRVPTLRDFPEEGLDGERFKLLPEIIRRRARHVITENARVLKAVKTLETNDLNQLGMLFRESHSSMRDDYAVSTPEIDLLVDLANQRQDVYGARLTGGGFGGSVVIAVMPESASKAAEEISRQYSSETGLKPKILLPFL